MLTQEIQTISPAFEKNNIPVTFATDNNFVPYIGVTVESLVKNSSAENNYDIVILYSNSDEQNIKRLKSLEQKNVSVRFYDMTDLMEEYKEDWYVHWEYSNATYFRFFVPEIFKDYSKILYLDGDIIILEDIADLYNINLEDNYLAGVQDISQQIAGYIGEKYREEELRIEREKYINAGVLILNIKKLKEINFTQLCLDTLRKLKSPMFMDQDIINYVSQGHIKYIPYNYNLLWNCINFYEDANKKIKKETYREYITAWKNPKIIHYAGAYKPWKQPWLKYSEYFWKYAEQTFFYEEIITANPAISFWKMINRTAGKRRMLFQYLKYKLKKSLTFSNIKNRS